MSHDLRPRWSMDEKGRLVIMGSVRGHLQLGKGAWGFGDVYGERDAKIVLSVIEKGNYAARSRKKKQ